MPPSTLPEAVAPHYEIEDGTSKGGNRRFTCIHCKESFKGSLTRRLAHLLGPTGEGIAICKKISLEDKEALRNVCDSIQNQAAGGSDSASQPAGNAGVSNIYTSNHLVRDASRAYK